MGLSASSDGPHLSPYYTPEFNIWYWLVPKIFKLSEDFDELGRFCSGRSFICVNKTERKVNGREAGVEGEVSGALLYGRPGDEAYGRSECISISCRRALVHAGGNMHSVAKLH